MAIIWEHDFEDNSLAGYDSVTGTPTIQTSVVYEGTRALRCNPSTSQHRLFDTFASTTQTIACSFRIRRATASEESPYLFFLTTTGLDAGLFARYESAVGIRLYSFNPGETLLDTYTPWAVDEWTHIEVRADTSANPWDVAWRVNAVDQGTFAPAIAAITFAKLDFGIYNYNMTWDAYYDTVAVSDQNTFITDVSSSRRRFKRLYGPAQLGTSAADLYTVPANTRTTIRRIFANNPSGSPVDFTLSIGADAAATRIYDSRNIPAGGDINEMAHDRPLEAGEKIQGFVGTAGTVTLTVDGIEETL